MQCRHFFTRHERTYKEIPAAWCYLELLTVQLVLSVIALEDACTNEIGGGGGENRVPVKIERALY
jgi:hypothetical protein